MTETILVICPRRPARFILALSALAALRTHHKTARLIGLTNPQTQFIAKTLPYLDDCWLDPRTSMWDIRNLLELRAELRSAAFVRVYDFEQSQTSRLYFHLMHGWRIASGARAQIAWSGDMAGTALFHDNPRKTKMHLVDRLQDQLRAAGVFEHLPADVSWAARQVRDFSAPFRMNQPFAMLCLDSETGETWPTERFAALAEWFASRKLTPLLVGFSEHTELAERICQRCPDAIDITGKAPLIDTVFLAWAAAAAVGGDCAAMHIAAIANCRCVVLCASGSDPAVGGPRGQRVQILSRGHLAEINTPEILTLLGDLGPNDT
jgi:ADP-heptose:LPS heptosyltransferase